MGTEKEGVGEQPVLSTVDDGVDRYLSKGQVTFRPGTTTVKIMT